MTKEKLKQYNDLKIEISKLENRIDRLKKQSEIVSDVVQNGYKRHMVIRGYDCERAYKLDLTIKKLEELRDRVEEEGNNIMKFISAIPKTEIRDIFSLRFFNGLQLFEVADVMNDLYKTDKYTDDNVRKKIDRYLKKI